MLQMVISKDFSARMVQVIQNLIKFKHFLAISLLLEHMSLNRGQFNIFDDFDN